MALLTGVCPHMVSQVVLSLECFITNLAWKWSLVGVNPFMNLQVVALGELSITVLADVSLLGVPLHVTVSVLASLDVVVVVGAVENVAVAVEDGVGVVQSEGVEHLQLELVRTHDVQVILYKFVHSNGMVRGGGVSDPLVSSRLWAATVAR